jgi:biopolymer transport protein ExbD
MSLTFRRSSTVTEPRFELAPLLDVIFLLLTFFLYSQVLLTRVDILPINLPTFSGGDGGGRSRRAGDYRGRDGQAVCES